MATGDAVDPLRVQVMNSDAVLLERSMRPDLGEVAPNRRAIAGAVARAGGHDDLVEDVELVASELLTNAVEQSPTAHVRVVVRERRTMVSLTVANRREHSAPPPPSTWHEHDLTGERGRGLAIVAALSERVEVDERDGWTIITCWWSVHV